MGDIPVWINGAAQAMLPCSDRGLAYGDGLFETIRVAAGRPTFADLHWQRLQSSCARLQISLDLDRLRAEVDAFLQAHPVRVGVLKVIVTRGSGGRGYNPQGCSSPRRILSLHPLPQYRCGQLGARVKACELRLGRSMVAGMKHLNRLEQVLARAEWQGQSYDEGLLFDLDGQLIEGTMSNVFLVTHDGELITPDLSFSGVAGVCREFVMAFARRQGIVVREQAVKTLVNVAEIFLCNSVNGVWPVVEYDGKSWPVGPVTVLIRDRVLEEFNA